MLRNNVVTKGGVILVLVSSVLIAFIGKWEDGGKPQATVYADKLAGGLPTACGGITKHTSPYPVIVGEVWSKQKCEQVAQMVLEKTQLTLARCITGKQITQNAFDALSSHAHNNGVANTCASRALGLMNAGQMAQGCDAIAHAPSGKPVWSYIKTRRADGSYSIQFVQGLYNRRLDERKLCLKGLAAPALGIKG